MFRNTRVLKLPAAIFAALALTALLAAAAVAVTSPTQTREGYVAQVEPICKKNTRANEQILAGVRQKIKQGKLDAAAGQFGKAATAFGRAVKQLKAVPQPVADATKLGKWLRILDDETKLLREISKALAAGNKSRVQTLYVRLTHNGNVANNSVLGFDFDHCLIDSSKFE
jgi:hypothetical protein